MTLSQQNMLDDRWVMGADGGADDDGNPTDDVGKQHTLVTRALVTERYRFITDQNADYVPPARGCHDRLLCLVYPLPSARTIANQTLTETIQSI